MGNVVWCISRKRAYLCVCIYWKKREMGCVCVKCVRTYNRGVVFWIGKWILVYGISNLIVGRCLSLIAVSKEYWLCIWCLGSNSSACLIMVVCSVYKMWKKMDGLCKYKGVGSRLILERGSRYRMMLGLMSVYNLFLYGSRLTSKKSNVVGCL